MVHTKRFYSHGKLLLTGEYLVLFGARALAVPVKFGQWLEVSEDRTFSSITWTANEKGMPWFKAEFSVNNLEIIDSSDFETASRLQFLLRSARTLNSEFLLEPANIETDLDFPRSWGLGTSSTLTVNVAEWAVVDPFKLHRMVSTGSGYDVACALNSSPIIYQLKRKISFFEPIHFLPGFSRFLYFLYLDKKQDSARSIANFNCNDDHCRECIQKISEITEAISATSDFSVFMKLLEQHENILSEIIKMPTIKISLFQDFEGVIKSLGAWGGDFVMVASSLPENEVASYFFNRGYKTFFNYSQMVLQTDTF